MTVIVGADAGGTKTVAAVSVDGQEVARVTGPGGAVRPGRAMTAGSVIGAVVRQGLNQSGKLRAQILVVGAAGVGREDERVALRNALRLEDLADRLVVVTDLELAREAAFGDAPGIVLLAGTGSVAAGRFPDGSIQRQGGYGWQMGDEGSGYALGKAALAAVGRRYDGRGPDTRLTAAVAEQTVTGDHDALVRWSVTAGPAEVAGLARAVLGAAEEGDAVAIDILSVEAGSLAQLAITLVGRWPGDGPVEVAQGGSLLRPGPYRDLVDAALGAHPRLRPHPGTPDGVEGALRIAARALAEGPR